MTSSVKLRSVPIRFRTKRMPDPLPPDTPPADLFEPSGFGVRCMVCGRHGGVRGTWWRACADGHPHECPDPMCGRIFPNRQALASHTRWIGTNRHRTETP